ncbi:MAG: hypothetical protein QNJ65_04580 [Xenococcaceae cyanobacterium MO_234.B1]|nr:hypothetical protein [Xenococcaceae cyanobacterium MO_234.B1]
MQKTLDACTQENVQQMEQALDEIYCAFSQGAQHNYEQALQILDVDMSGQPCGPKAAFATKGYFAIAARPSRTTIRSSLCQSLPRSGSGSFI